MEITLEKRMKGRAATWRRYPSGEQPAYDKIYLNRRADSHILNKGNRSIWDIGKYDCLQGLKSSLFEYVGNDEGLLEPRDSESLPKSTEHTPQAIIPGLLDNLEIINQKIREYKAEKEEYGYPSVKEPDHLKTERLKTEALLDVCGAEAEWLQKELREFETKEAAKKEDEVLMYGTEMSSWGNPPKEIDGQIVSKITDEDTQKTVYIIDDSRSPYDGMSLFDYREMAKQWRKGRQAHHDQLRKQREDEIFEKGFSDVHIPMTNSRVPREDLPAWPEDAVNFKKVNK